MHLGYAIQWLAFAAIALGFYLRLSLVREGGGR
jgi:cytochrome oxidase assembly protein ShyY1